VAAVQAGDREALPPWADWWEEKGDIEAAEAVRQMAALLGAVGAAEEPLLMC
jgi:hypothetical protein